jgi:cell division protein FtsB
MIVTLISLTSVVSWAVLLNVSKPYVIGAQQAAELTEKTQNLHRLEAENARLAKQCAFLNQPDGIEYEARLKGYLMPGEQSIVLTPAPNAGH